MDEEKLTDEIKERYEMVLYPSVNGLDRLHLTGQKN